CYRGCFSRNLLRDIRSGVSQTQVEQVRLPTIKTGRGCGPSPNRRLAVERISGLRVCEELKPSTVLTEERVQVEDILSELRPVSQEDVSSSACSSGPEWNVAHVNHSRVAALTLHGKASLRSGFRQYSSIGSLGLLSIKLSSRSVSLIRTPRQH